MLKYKARRNVFVTKNKQTLIKSKQITEERILRKNVILKMIENIGRNIIKTYLNIFEVT